MNSEEKFNPDNYKGEAFKKFVDDETHYAIERAQKHWLIKNFNQETFLDIRYKVFTGLVKKAVEFFGGHEREQNIRCDLRAYIGF